MTRARAPRPARRAAAFARTCALAAALALAACGADGPPVAPSRDAPPETGIRLSGDARLGLVWRAP